MSRRWLVLLVLGLTLLVGVSMIESKVSSEPQRNVVQTGPLIVVGMPSLSWRDISATRTPQLWAMATRGAVAAQATRDTIAHSCADQSWLTLSAGAAASIAHARPAPSGSDVAGVCPDPLVPTQALAGSAVYPQWSRLLSRERSNATTADLGRIASTLARAGQCIAGAGVHAPLGAADRDGLVAYYDRDVESVDLQVCPVTLIGLTAPDDAYVGRLLQRAPSDATIVVTGMADDTGPEILHAVVMTGPGVAHGLLSSLSTRQDGLIQTTDLSALVLARLGSAAPYLDEGRRPHVTPMSGATAPITRVDDLTRALQEEHPFVPTFFALYLGGCALGLLLGGAAWWLSRRTRSGWWRPSAHSVRGGFAILGAMAAATPMATILVGGVPWWRASHPQLALCLSLLAIAAATTALALLGPWRGWVGGPMAFVAAVTLFVISQDVIHGSRWQLISLMGLQPVYGGRFFGQGNVAFAVYATAALLLAAVLAGLALEAGQRRLGTLAVAVLGAGTVVIDASPSWGADGGGTIALVPPFVYLALCAAGLALTWKRVALTAAATVGLAGAVAVFDSLGPARSRTHLGDFVANLWTTGNLNGLQQIWTENGTMLTSSWLNRSVLLVIAAIVLVLLRPRVLGGRLRAQLAEVPMLGRGLAAIGVCWLVGFAFNDSGTAIPPTGLLLLVPLLVVLAACRALQRLPVREPRPLGATRPTPPPSTIDLAEFP